MRKLFILLFFSTMFQMSVAQIPAGYYSTATGSGYTLKTQLHNIIDDHTVRTYTQLWSYYDNTDLDTDGYILDMYSENPSGVDPYNFTWSTDQCGSYSGESDCYNREHSMPKSWWGGSTAVPQYTDIHHVVPTDGYVNFQRSNLSYGEISSPTWVSSNGCRRGPARSGLGYTGTVFEPIDEYKGDFARIYFYMATRYEDVVSTWPGSAMLDGSNDKVFNTWALDMLLDWHANDPVSQKEIDRNNTIYSLVQGNRNPFVDHPEYAQAIWGGCVVNPPSSTTGAERCGTGIMTLSAVPGTGGNTIRWYLDNSTSTVFYTGTPATFTFNGTYTLYVSSYDSILGCESSRVPITGTVNSIPSVSFSGLNTNYLITDAAATLTGNPAGGSFSGNGISGNTFDPGSAGVGTHSITYMYTDGNGCSNSSTRNVNVTNSTPSPSSGGLSDLIISAVFDGPLSGGNPKGVEIYVQNDIADLSVYGIGTANNGGGTDGEEFTFPAVAANAGDYIYCVSTATGFSTFMGFTHDYDDFALGINGDDAIELFKNDSVVDVFGDINTSGTGQTWEYTDGWASRKNCTGPNGGTFDVSNWTYSGIDALDGETTNATATNPIPVGVYNCPQTNLIITGVYDGPLLGGHPKGIEFYVANDIADLSIYGFGSANNGGGTDGQEFAFPAVTAMQGSFIYVAADSSGFREFIGFDADYIHPTAPAINGDDAIELFKSGTVVDIFGDINVDGTGQPWEYLDGWAFRKNCTNNDGSTFYLNNWTYSGVDALDGEINNATATNPIPIGSYMCGDICPTTYGTDTHTACNSYAWINGITYTSSNSTAKDTLINSQGCDSIVTLNLTINNSSTSTDIQTACNAYTWIDGITYTSDNNTATYTITNSAGCDSVITLNLTINNPTYFTHVVDTCASSYTWIDGNTYTISNNTATHVLINSVNCDSVVSLDLTLRKPTLGADTIVTCAPTYMWINGVTYSTNNSTATHTITNAAGCDSTITLNLTFNTFSASTDVQDACESYTWINGVTYTSSINSAKDTLIGAQGCDSIITLDLTINQPTSSVDVISACGSYTWVDGNTYTSNNNTATYITTNSVGCDSTVTLNLAINQPSTGVDIVTACGPYTWIDGNTYTSNNNTATHTIANSNLCDSVITLNLTINQPTTGIDEITTCASSIMWIDGNTYSTNNNTATHTLTNAAGCDSIVTLNLTFSTFSAGVDNATACDSYAWIDGNTYTANNNSATHTLVGGSVHGCDSIITLDLTINSSSTSSDVQTACNLFTWIDGNTYTSSNNSATHILTNSVGCDSTITLDLTINESGNFTIDTTILEGGNVIIGGNTYDSEGTFIDSLMNSQGCDSILTINISVNPNGIPLSSLSSIKVYPNPSFGSITIELEDIGNKEIKILNILGEEVYQLNTDKTKIDIDLDVESGLYYVLVNKAAIKLIVE